MAAVLLLSGRLVWVQGLDASARAQEAIAQRTVTRTIPALRGDILDRNGTTMAELGGALRPVGQPAAGRRVPPGVEGRRGHGDRRRRRRSSPRCSGWSVSDTEETLTGDRGFVYLQKNVEPEGARRASRAEDPRDRRGSRRRSHLPGRLGGWEHPRLRRRRRLRAGRHRALLRRRAQRHRRQDQLRARCAAVRSSPPASSRPLLPSTAATSC